MSTPIPTVARGIAYTFYSFKGGVGRSMALANVAALLAKWGRRVLVVDWDLEAPGLEKFFANYAPNAAVERAAKVGIVDLVFGHAGGRPLSWREALISLPIGSNGSKVSFLSAGQSGSDYSARLQGIDFGKLFAEKALGTYIEELRNQWLDEYEYVLIDSRTGVTDIGGICTVQLADVLVLLVTTTESSVEGTKSIIEKARKQQQLLPVDRQRLLAVPVPARDESRTEYQKAAEWKVRFAAEFAEVFADWLPSDLTARNAIEVLRVPYVPYWSFGERLPAIEEGTGDPSSLGHAYEILSRLLDARLDWHKAMEGQLPEPPTVLARNDLDEGWVTERRLIAERGLRKGFGSLDKPRSFVEFRHGCLSHLTERTLIDLRKVAKKIEGNYNFPIGAVLENSDGGPLPRKDGIDASIDYPGVYAYWALRKNGDFYSLSTLVEDEHTPGTIQLTDRVVQATKMILRCGKLYQEFGADPGTTVRLNVRYGGIRDRVLMATTGPSSWQGKKNSTENEIEASVSFQLGSLPRQLPDLAQQLCSPLFELFEFSEFPTQHYVNIVNDFVARIR